MRRISRSWAALSRGLLAAQLAVLAGDGHALAGALADQVGLELGDDREDLQEHPGERVVPVVQIPCAENAAPLSALETPLRHERAAVARGTISSVRLIRRTVR